MRLELIFTLALTACLFNTGNYSLQPKSQSTSDFQPSILSQKTVCPLPPTLDSFLQPPYGPSLRLMEGRLVSNIFDTSALSST